MVITRQAQSPPVEVIIISHSSFLIYYSLTSGTT